MIDAYSVPCAPDDDRQHRPRPGAVDRRRPECRSRRLSRPAPSARRSAFCPRCAVAVPTVKVGMRVLGQRLRAADASASASAAQVMGFMRATLQRFARLNIVGVSVDALALYQRRIPADPGRPDARRHRSVDRPSVIGRVPDADAADVDRAVDGGARGVRRRAVEGRDGAGSRTRAVRARRTSSAQRADELAELETRNTGKPIVEVGVRHRRRRDLLRVLRRPRHEDSRRRAFRCPTTR